MVPSLSRGGAPHWRYSLSGSSVGAIGSRYRWADAGRVTRANSRRSVLIYLYRNEERALRPFRWWTVEKESNLRYPAYQAGALDGVAHSGVTVHDFATPEPITSPCRATFMHGFARTQHKLSTDCMAALAGLEPALWIDPTGGLFSGYSRFTQASVPFRYTTLFPRWKRGFQFSYNAILD